ncbi:MAG: hypothetical protein V4545_08920 [Pseudomonadota bacterium]
MIKPPFSRQAIDANLIKHRGNFTKLLISNPNYFGNLDADVFPKAVFPIKGNTLYENLGCLGLEPQFDLLKTVLYINQDSGYSGELCSAGSQEYVRFYLSYDDGATWQDQGVTSITVHDVKHEGRLEYALEMPIKPEKLSCKKANQILARAILSWNVAPPANTPNYVPVWGNAVDAYVLARPAAHLVLKDLMIPALLQELNEVVNLEQTIAIKKENVALSALLRTYEKEGVELHRSVFPLVAELISNPTQLSALHALPNLSLQKSPLLNIGGFKIDWPKIIDVIQNTDGNVDYEELNCIGLQPRASLDHLVGILKVKKPQGYSGNLCSKGSQEYVRFYMDFGSGWQDMGLSSVQVYDMNPLPKTGLHYAVMLPVNLDKYRKPCHSGPVFAKMRAVMSWNSPPPANTPYYKPTWGNAEETTVLLTPKKTNSTGLPAPAITAVCGQSVAEINQSTGLLSNAGFDKAPFANSLWISGHIGNAPDASSGAAKLKYRLMASVDGVNFNPVTNAFDIRTEQLEGGVWNFPAPISLTPPADGFIEYQEDLVAELIDPIQTFVNLDILGVLHTAGDASPYRWLRVDVQDTVNPAIIYASEVVKVRVDNAAPTATITMDQGPCSDINAGDSITGTYVTADAHFDSVSIAVLGAGGGAVTKTPTSGPSLTGESGTWSFSTTGMTPCGYVVQLTSHDRAIIGYVSGTAYAAGGGHYYQPLAIGFCLRKG